MMIEKSAIMTIGALTAAEMERPMQIRLSLNPGAPVIHQMSAAVDKKLRAGAHRISVKHFSYKKRIQIERIN